MAFCTSLYAVEHTQLQMKVQADSMTGKELHRSGSSPCGFLTTRSLTEGFLHLPTQSMDLSYSKALTGILCSADWTHMGFFENSRRVLLIFFLPCLKTKGISCFPMFLFLPVTKILHEKVKKKISVKATPQRNAHLNDSQVCKKILKIKKVPVKESKELLKWHIFIDMFH